MEGAGLITVGILLVVGVLVVAFSLLRYALRAAVVVLRVSGVVVGQRELGPYELGRRRAVASSFVLVLCMLWPLGKLPPWGPFALLLIAGVAALFVLAAFYGTRNGPRDLSGTVASLVVAGGVAALLRWQWYLPSGYGAAGEFVDQWVPGFTRVATFDGNQLLQGIYVAVLIAALVRALICVQLLGGAARVIARAMRQRGMPLRPVDEFGFWAEIRESFARGRDGRPRRD
jgi:hypothetical protein